MSNPRVLRDCRNIKEGSPAHSDHYLKRGRGFTRVLGVAGWGGKGAEIEVRACGRNLYVNQAR